MRESPDLSQNAYRWLVWLATLAFVSVSLSWALLTPGFRTPDEPVHFNSVIRLEYGGGWPAPGDARVGPGVRDAMAEAAFWTRLPRGNKTDGSGFFQDAVPATAPISIDGSNALPGPGSAEVDYATQHPPLYYAAAAGFSELVGAKGRSWETQLLWARVFSILCASTLPLAAAQAAKILVARRRFSAIAAFAPLAVPQLAHIAGSVSNDALTATLVGWSVVGAAWTVARGLSWRITIPTGIVAGLAMLTKGLGLALVPILVLAFAWAAGRPRVRKVIAHVGAALGLAFGAGGFWWAITLVRYHTLVKGAAGAHYEPDGQTGRNVFSFAVRAVPRVVESFWGRFGWLELPMSALVVGGLSFALAALVALALARPAGQLRVRVVLLAFPFVAMAPIFAEVYGIYLTSGQLPALQGRYIFGSIPGLAGLAVAGFALATVRTSDRIRAVAGAAGVAATAAVALYGLFVGYRGFYVPVDSALASGWSLWREWTLAGGAGIPLAVAGALVVVFAVAVAAVRLGAFARGAESAAGRGGS